MLRKYISDPSGYWLVTHPDHAFLAGQFAEAWGNDLFLTPEPRADVLEAVFHHDDGWKIRDAAPEITREGKPSAFSRELVGKYSAFEEINLSAYLAVRQRALEEISTRNPYAAILVSKHTYNLLSARADRSTIAAADLPLLDKFLDDQLAQQEILRAQLIAAGQFSAEFLAMGTFENHFRLLQACDNLSLLTCVDFPGESSLLHPLPTATGAEEVMVRSVGSRHFVLDPWPFQETSYTFHFPARFVSGETFSSTELFRAAFDAAIPEQASVHLSAS